MKQITLDKKTELNMLPSGLTDNLYSDFIRFLDAKPKTIATYTRAIRQFYNFIKAREIINPTRETVLDFRKWLIQKNKPTTVQNYIVTVRLFFRWLEQQGLYKNVADKIKSPTISKEHKKDYLTSKQVKALLNNIKLDNSEQGLRDYAIISTMVVGGLRTIEIVRSNISDLRNVGDDAVLFIQGKGRDEKTDYIKLPYHVENAIREYLRSRKFTTEQEPLFISTSNNNFGSRLTTRPRVEEDPKMLI